MFDWQSTPLTVELATFLTGAMILMSAARHKRSHKQSLIGFVLEAVKPPG